MGVCGLVVLQALSFVVMSFEPDKSKGDLGILPHDRFGLLIDLARHGQETYATVAVELFVPSSAVGFVAATLVMVRNISVHGQQVDHIAHFKRKLQECELPFLRVAVQIVRLEV